MNILTNYSYDLSVLSRLGQYTDIRRLLWNAAESFGAKIISKAKVSSIDVAKEGRPSVRLTSGEILEADAIIGTDGLNSIAQKEVLGEEVKEITLGMSLFRSDVMKLAGFTNGY